jgi:hypothetical protein
VYEKTQPGSGIAGRLAGIGHALGMGVTTAPRAIASSSTKAIEALRAASQEGVTIPKHAAEPGLISRTVSGIVSKLPGGDTAREAAADRTASQMGAAANRTAETSTGSTASAEEAGNVARSNIEKYVAPSNEGGVLAQRSDKFYDRLRDMMESPPAGPYAKLHHLSAAGIVTGPIKAATGEMPKTMETAQKIVNEVEASGRPGITKTVNEVLGAATNPDGVTFEGMHRLRSDLRAMLRSDSMPEGMVRGDVKRLVSAIGEDLEGLVDKVAGPKGIEALKKADVHYALTMERADKLNKILGTTGKSDEAVFSTLYRMATSGAGADAKTLALARKAIPPDEWEHITSAAVSNLGNSVTTNGAKAFDPDKFLRLYSGLSDKGKNLLFGANSSVRGSLDRLTTIAGRWPKIVGGGHDEMAHATAMAAGIETLHNPLVMIPVLMANRVVGKVLSAPATLNSLANWTQRFETVFTRPSQVNFMLLNRSSQTLDHEIQKEAGEAGKATEFTNKLRDIINGVGAGS